MREYVLDAARLTRYRQIGFTKCPRCGEGFKVGEEVVSRHSRRSGPPALLHKKCYDETLYE